MGIAWQVKRIGVYLSDGANIKLTDNQVLRNGGIGIKLNSAGGSLLVQGNMVSANQDNGIDVSDANNITVDNNQVTNNRGHGIAVDKSSGQGIISGNNSRLNSAWGILVNNGDNITLSNNKVSGSYVNEGEAKKYGGIWIAGGHPYLMANISANNNGPGIWWSNDAQPTIGVGNFSDGKLLK